ncbi:MAG: hypothetical protein ACUVXB_09815 [Bryobacteraceae bacterium]
MTKLLTLPLLAMLLALLRDLNYIEAAFLAVAASLSVLASRFGDKHFRAIEFAGRRLSSHPVWSFFLLSASVIVLRLALLPWSPVPSPVITDEYSHLLLADTLAHGRLTNPPHPMWQHFETIHVIFQPTYNSMYLPGQALFLAAGQILFSSPWAGVLLSAGLMAGVIFWMLKGWFPSRWALIGGAIAGFRYGLGSYWVNSYWGGAVPALAGAVVLGSAIRLSRQPQTRIAAIMAVGCAVLVNTRPYEGVAVILPAFAWLVWGYLGAAPAVRLRILRDTAFPVVLIGLLAGGATAYYCFRVTGNPLRLPYQVNQETYGWPTTLAFFDPQPVNHRHLEMQSYYEWELSEHEKLTHPWAKSTANLTDAVGLWSFYAGPFLTLPLLFLLRSRPWCRAGLLMAVSILTIAAVTIEQSRYPHYVAPATGAFTGLLVLGIRVAAVQRSRRGRWGLALVRWGMVGLVLAAVVRWSPALSSTAHGYYSGYLSWCCSRSGDLSRVEADRQLQASPGRHLVLVRYGPAHHWMDEWVHNEADIDAAKVVWARDLGPEQNAALLRYYADRQVWLATPGGPPGLSPYPVPQPADSGSQSGP